MNCFVVNLESAVDRRQTIVCQLQALTIAYEIFTGTNGRKLDAAELREKYDVTRAAREREKMTLAEIGCTLSHLGIYRKMVEKNISHALILEDDAKLGRELPAVVEQLAQHYPADHEVVVLLNHVPKYFKKSLVPLTERYSLAQPYGLCWHTHGYFITQAAARRMLENLYPVWMVPDHWAKFQELGFVTVRALVPYCVGLSEAAAVSSIGDRGVKACGLAEQLWRCRDRYWHAGLPAYMRRKLSRLMTQAWAWLSGNVVHQPETW